MFKNIMAFAVAMALALSAHATSWFQFEANIGGTAYTEAADGLWLQQGFAHEVKLTAPAIEAGIIGDLWQSGRYGLSYRLGYAWLGSISSQGYATSDANYDLQTKSMRVAMPLATFTGSGHDAGFYFTIEPTYTIGDWRLGIEGGPYLHKATWSADATGQVNFIGQAPGSSHFEDQEGWHLGYVVGASVEYKRFTLRYEYFGNGSKAGNPIPALWTHAHVLTAGYRF